MRVSERELEQLRARLVKLSDQGEAQGVEAVGLQNRIKFEESAFAQEQHPEPPAMHVIGGPQTPSLNAMHERRRSAASVT